jgi:hypothetical protein
MKQTIHKDDLKNDLIPSGIYPTGIADVHQIMVKNVPKKNIIYLAIYDEEGNILTNKSYELLTGPKGAKKTEMFMRAIGRTLEFNAEGLVEFDPLEWVGSVLRVEIELTEDGLYNNIRSVLPYESEA